MDTEKTNDNKDKTPGADFGFDPEDFKGIFEKMGECCKAQNGMPDCATMMKTMMANCCELKSKK